MTEDGTFSDEELALIKSVERSKLWRLIRDALALERERLFQRPPSLDNDRDIWKQRGALDEVNRLLRNGPHLVVFYERHVRAMREAKAAGKPLPDVTPVPSVGDAPPLDEEV